ncbi:hypothetical protein WME98_24540 [Sorangium sp. So ce296]|uniref:hypothetical protein n=1 Tax=Sorangium sp. So ce296 TaxID=3133296 RepID=UPI003F5E9B5B
MSTELHVPLTAYVIVAPGGRYAAVHEQAIAARRAPAHPAGADSGPPRCLGIG